MESSGSRVAARYCVGESDRAGKPCRPPNHLFVASAANRPTAVALSETFNRAAAAQGGPAVRVTDVKPLPPKDPNGIALFYAMIAWVFGGYIASTLIGLIGSPRSPSTRR
jgi:hypothetical protein